ncbi:MAG: CDP-diacylglycerol--glycerol-3-phosphate 3-phosphatidyltransferase [Actinomycetes bacterium]
MSRTDPMAVPPSSASLANVPNALTMLRLALVPVFIAALSWSVDNPQWRYVSAVVFLVASITDFVDGDLARRRDQVTTFGKIADPIADKALIGAALIGLSLLGELSWWVTAVIVVREVGVTALRFWVIEHGVIPASRGGKVKTVLQIVAILAYLWPWPDGVHWVAQLLMLAAVVVTVVTGLDYVMRALRLRRSATATPPAPSGR